MAYDEDLAQRIRESIATTRGVNERAMFGGLAFLVGGHLAVSASGVGGLLLRCDPDATDELLRAAHVGPFEMRGKPMRGWLRVDADGVRGDDELARWVAIGVAYARSLPSKV